MHHVTRSAAYSLALAMVLVGCGDDTSETSTSGAGSGAQEEGEGSPLTFATPPPASVKGNVVTLDLAVEGVSIVAADGDTSGTTGHLHVFVDRPVPAPGAVIPKEPGILHTTETEVMLTGLSVGDHEFAVVLGDGTHRRIGDGVARAEVSVEGPSVNVSGPSSVPSGSPVPLEMSVEGLELVAADGDQSGRTGHLHVFVDRPPTGAGQPIPKEDGIIHTTDTAVSLPGLAPGEHTVWVVLGDGTHAPLAPPVMAKTTFVVDS